MRFKTNTGKILGQAFNRYIHNEYLQNGKKKKENKIIVKTDLYERGNQNFH